MWSHETELSTFECEELYQLYLRLVEQTIREIKDTVPVGETQQFFLDMHRPLPKEHFEARLFQLAEDPERLAQVVDQMQSADAHEELDSF